MSPRPDAMRSSGSARLSLPSPAGRHCLRRAVPSSTTSDAAYRVGILTDLDTLNPMNTVADQSVQWLVYDKLMVYDAHLRPALSLAKS